MITATENRPRTRWSRARLPIGVLGAVLAVVTLGAVSPIAASAQPESSDDGTCQVEAFNNGECLVGMPSPGVSGLTAGVQAAVRSGRDDVVDKFAAQPFVTDEMSAEIAAARVNVPDVVYRLDERPPEPGTIVPFGGNDGQRKDQWNWEINHHQPIETCDDDGCYVKDWADITFKLNIFEKRVAVLEGEFNSRNQLGTFGVKDMNCQVKKDLGGRRDPVRGTFTGCVGTTRTMNYQIFPTRITNNVAEQEQDWLLIQFESYDSRIGLSFGEFEYKSQNWTKLADGTQYFYVNAP